MFGTFLPSKQVAITFAQIMGLVLIAALTAHIFLKYIKGPATGTVESLDYRVRQCTTTKYITDHISRYLMETPDNVVECGIAKRIIDSPKFFVGIPAIASMNAVADFGDNLRTFLNKTVDERCNGGKIRYGDIADALDAEANRVCVTKRATIEVPIIGNVRT